MPYIASKRRREVSPSGFTPETAGELNYVLTRILVAYLKLHAPNYITLNDILGALEGAKMEFYRRVVAPYEDKKREENGDVYC